MQIAPGSIDPNSHGAAKTSEKGEAEATIDINDVSGLLDKRSELMKRGRVKRVYYQETD